MRAGRFKTMPPYLPLPRTPALGPKTEIWGRWVTSRCCTSDALITGWLSVAISDTAGLLVSPSDAISPQLAGHLGLVVD